MKERFSEFPRISKGLNPVGGAKRLAPVSLFQGFILLEHGQNLPPLALPDDDNDRYNLGEVLAGSERHLPALKPTDICFQVKREREGEARRLLSLYF